MYKVTHLPDPGQTYSVEPTYAVRRNLDHTRIPS